MFKTLASKYPKDKDFPERTFRLEMLARVLDGKHYDALRFAFHDERDGGQQYIPIRERRPSVRYRLCGLVVDDAVSLLFSEGHFPAIESKAKETREALERLVKECRLNELMIHAATRGAVGSVAIFFRVLKQRAFFEVLETAFLTPKWKKDAPDTLEQVVELYKAKGKEVRAAGYKVADEHLNDNFWVRTEWDESEERRFVPWRVLADERQRKEGEPKPETIDTENTVQHELGFVPVVWVRNLPGGDKIDGAPTFPDEAIETSIEIDYQLSQAGRGLKYSSDPTLLIKEPAFAEQGPTVRSASNALVVSKEGDAKLLEINGTAVEAVVDYVKAVRELALESMHGNRAEASKISAAQSGRAMELLNQALIWLADRLRISYGEGALLELLTMIVKASEKMGLLYKDGETKVGKLSPEALALRWPRWYQPTGEDRQQDATTLTTLTDGGIIQSETATKVVAADYDIEDPTAESTAAQAERQARDMAAQRNVAVKE